MFNSKITLTKSNTKEQYLTGTLHTRIYEITLNLYTVYLQRSSRNKFYEKHLTDFYL